jgi:hypothetical protein
VCCKWVLDRGTANFWVDEPDARDIRGHELHLGLYGPWRAGDSDGRRFAVKNLDTEIGTTCLNYLQGF